MKNAALLLTALLALLAAARPGLAAQGVAASDSDAETAAIDPYKVWKAETDQDRKLVLASDIMQRYPGTKAAEAVGYASIFDKGLTDARRKRGAEAYYNAYSKAGKIGAYMEYALLYCASLEKDPAKRYEYSSKCVATFSPGNLLTEAVKQHHAARYALAKAYVDAGKIDEAVALANKSFAEGDADPYLYLHVAGLTSYAAKDFNSKGSGSTLVGQVGPWADHALVYIASGNQPPGVGNWLATKSQVACYMHQIKGWDRLLAATKRGTSSSPGDYRKAVDDLSQAVQCADANNWIPAYLMGQAFQNEYQLYNQRYDAVPDKQSVDAQSTLADVNEAADGILRNYVAVLRIISGNANLNSVETQIQPTVTELWKYRYPDSPDGWRSAVASGNIPPAPTGSTSGEPVVAEDRTPPEIRVTSPDITRGGGVQAALGTVTVAGQAVDASGIQAVTVNGRSASVDSRGYFSITLAVGNGPTPVHILATDTRGNTGSRDFSVQGAVAQTGGGGGTDNGAATTATGTYYALVIGNDSYQNVGRLQTARNDARGVERALRERFGFQTKLLLDASRDQVLEALNQYRKQLDANSNLLIYYAGHGTYDRDVEKAYWLPVDAQPDENVKWISSDEVTTNLRGIAARHVLLVSDSCYSGMIQRDARTQINPSQRELFLKKMSSTKSRTLMASGGNEPVADGGGAGHSVFATAFLRGLDQMSKSAFTGDELFFEYVREYVAGTSAQTPQYDPLRNSGHEGGDFVFVRRQ